MATGGHQPASSLRCASFSCVFARRVVTKPSRAPRRITNFVSRAAASPIFSHATPAIFSRATSAHPTPARSPRAVLTTVASIARRRAAIRARAHESAPLEAHLRGRRAVALARVRAAVRGRARAVGARAAEAIGRGRGAGRVVVVRALRSLGASPLVRHSGIVLAELELGREGNEYGSAQCVSEAPMTRHATTRSEVTFE